MDRDFRKPSHIGSRILKFPCEIIAIIQQHLNIMRSTYELQTSDFVELPCHFLKWFPLAPPAA